MNSADGQKIAMRGAGYYSANTVGAKNVIDKVGELVVEAVAKMPRLANGQPFAIADFGAADGGTSMDMMRRLVGAIRETEPHRAISITYTDLPHNDFSTLFRLSQGLLAIRQTFRWPRFPRSISSAVEPASIARYCPTIPCRSASPPRRCTGSAKGLA